MNVSVIVATYGTREWADLALDEALPSADRQGALEVFGYHDPEGTLAGVRNLAAQAAKGEWLCFLDADDELERGYLDAMREEQHRLSVCGYDAEVLLVPAVSYVTERLGETAARNSELVTRPRLLNTGRPLHEINRAVIGTLIRREFFLELGGFRDLSALEDWELWLRAERAGAHLVDVPDAVYRVHRRAGSRNSDQSLYEKIRAEHFAALREVA